MLRSPSLGRRLKYFLFLLLAAAQVAQAQISAQSSIRGKVIDPNRATVVGASVVAEAKGRSIRLSATTDQNGEFSIGVPQVSTPLP